MITALALLNLLHWKCVGDDDVTRPVDLVCWMFFVVELLLVLLHQMQLRNSDRSPQLGHQIQVGYWKLRFKSTSRCIFETTQDRAMVAMER